jgi:hypothetical protein
LGDFLGELGGESLDPPVTSGLEETPLYLAFEEIADFLAESVLFLGELEIHARSPSSC